MRIGFDAKRAFHNFTGLGNYSRFTVSALAKNFPQHQYILYTPPFKPRAELSFANCDQIETVQASGLWNYFPSIWRSLCLTKVIKNNHIDLYHGLSHELPNGIAQSGVPSIVSMHDLIFLRYPQYYKFIDRTIYTHKFKQACINANLIVAISQQTQDDLIHFFNISPDKIRKVYQGCDPQFYTPCTDTQLAQVASKYQLPDRYVLYVGTIEERKNLLSLVKAMRALPADVHLIAIGRRTAYAQQVDQAIASAQLGSRVHLMDRVNFTDLPAIYQQALVFVYPSIYEGFGIPVLEALNSGTPVITANTSSLPEVGGLAALYCPPYDCDTLADMLLTVLNKPGVAQAMRIKGYQQAEKFKADYTAQAMWKVYSELIEV